MVELGPIVSTYIASNMYHSFFHFLSSQIVPAARSLLQPRHQATVEPTGTQQRRNPQTCELTAEIPPATALQAGQPQPDAQQTAERGSTSTSAPRITSAIHATSNSNASPKNTTHHIIPSEGPQRAVEMDEDEDDGSGDGIGEEDGGQDDEDEAGDERDSADDDLSTPDKPPRIRCPIAPWLLRAFKDLVAKCQHRDCS